MQIISEPVGKFFAAAFIFIVVSPYIVRAIAIIYQKLGTYHVLERRIRKWEKDSNTTKLERFENPDPDDGEALWLKIKYVWEQYFAAVFVTAGLILVYQFQLGTDQATSVLSRLAFDPSFEAYAALGAMVLLLNLVMRVSAFTSWGYDNIDCKQVNNRIMSWGFSFNLTLYFLFFIGIVIRLVTGQIEFDIEASGEGLFLPIIYIASILGGVLLVAILGELFLYFTGVPDDLREVES
jgi:hypothetical protein